MHGLPRSGYGTVTPPFISLPLLPSLSTLLFLYWWLNLGFPTCQASTLVAQLHPILIVDFLNFPLRKVGAWLTVGDEDLG